MAGSVAFKVIGTGDCVMQEHLARDVVKHVKKLAADRDIKVPKKMRIGGKFGTYFYVCYNSNVVKNLILEVGEFFQLPIEWVQ